MDISSKKTGRTVGIGIQDFSNIISNHYFYVDKTNFIKEWWESGDSVTLIARPRRFGKTLTMSMVETFFSNQYADRADLFENLDIWKEERYRELQGTYPVISLSFANIKETTFGQTKKKICQLITNIYLKHSYLLESGVLYDRDIEFFKRISSDMEDSDATIAVYQLCDFLNRYYGKKVIILLDEYDTPMQEAYVNGYWEELVSFTRSMFNSMFKTNPSLERAIMTGITRVSKESIFSDLNNLKVVTTTSSEYADKFGFTEEEVFAGLEEKGFDEKDKELVKKWYDGFIFGKVSDIYNPWSIINYLDTNGILSAYWANSSSNSLVGKLIREGNADLKTKFESLIQGEMIETPIDEQIVYSGLNGSEEAVWSLLLASGYLKIISYQVDGDVGIDETPLYQLTLTNLEVRRMFRKMVKDWFSVTNGAYNEFIKSLLRSDIEAMEAYMNRVTVSSFSYFDTEKNGDDDEYTHENDEEIKSEKFYHGFVLGLLVELSRDYELKSNRESGYGRYDIMIIPRQDREGWREKNGIIIEFKIFNRRREKTLSETVEAALKQIEDKRYEEELLSRGIGRERIRKYGFAFEGKKVLIGEL